MMVNSFDGSTYFVCPLILDGGYVVELIKNCQTQIKPGMLVQICKEDQIRQRFDGYCHK